jgi:hypothetical protein
MEEHYQGSVTGTRQLSESLARTVGDSPQMRQNNDSTSAKRFDEF